tara:strand:+ start:1705 stop:2079 length:375 start_codon:yes stop_codon:yes gene_type:complete
MKSYLKIRTKAFSYAIKGLSHFIKEPHARIHIGFLILVNIMAYYLSISKMEWLAILLCCALVLSLEAINSAIEHLTDIISPNFNVQAGLVKDIAAAAVLLASIFSAIIGLIIFAPKMMDLFNFQ